MNKKIFLMTLLVFTILLSACASNTSTPVSASASTLPMQTQLVVGTILLEDTENAVTTEQAKELLPLWYVLQELNDSDTAAQEEKDGLVTQIQETMTTSQIKTIANMELTREDMQTLMQGNGKGTNSAQAGSNSNASSGGAGGPPDMGGIPGGDPGMGTSGTTSTTGSAGASPTANTPSALFELVIKLLQKKISQ